MYSVAILNGSFGFFSYNNDFLQKYPTTSLCMYYTQLSPLLLTLRCAIVWEYNRALASKTDQTQTTPTLLKSNTKKSWVFFKKNSERKPKQLSLWRTYFETIPQVTLQLRTVGRPNWLTRLSSVAPTRSRVRIPGGTNFHLVGKKNPLAVLAERLGPLGHGPEFGGFPAAERSRVVSS